MWKEKNFEAELDQIYLKRHKDLAVYIINKILPDEFFYIQPSSTGKYHPQCTHRPGGLIIHTKRLIYIALQLADALQLPREDKDILILAGILHDMAKKRSYQKEDNAYENHPSVAANVIRDNNKTFIKYASRQELKAIEDLVRYHMGAWTPEREKKDFKDYSLLELIFYFSDYLSSRKLLATPVDNVTVYLNSENTEAAQISANM